MTVRRPAARAPEFHRKENRRLRSRSVLFILVFAAMTPLAAQKLAPDVHRESHRSEVVSYWYGANYRTPFVVDSQTGKGADIRRNAIEYTHAEQSGILTSFADVTLSQSDMAEPAASGGTGARRQSERSISARSWNSRCLGGSSISAFICERNGITRASSARRRITVPT